MEISVIATTKPNYISSKEDFDFFSGKCAGVCYMPNDFQSLVDEDSSKTIRRINQTKQGGHHSVYDHNSISLYLNGIPKIVAMILNNEKMYTTSEKSARYTKMSLPTIEQEMYDKWLSIFKDLIRNKYQLQYPNFFTDSKIEKLAQENARYLISIFTPTSMVYTTTYRQLNIIISLIEKKIVELNKSEFEIRLKEELVCFIKNLRELPYMDESMQNNEKCRELSLFRKEHYKIKPYFSDVYITSYFATFAELAQAQRHRTIRYSIKIPNNYQFYIPPIIESIKLQNEWIKDCEKLKNNFPQGMLVEVVESGDIDSFILKMKERKCTFAQLEINDQTNKTLKRYAYELDKKKHPRSEEFLCYLKGARCCLKNYKCNQPCGFVEGVFETRII